VGCKAGLEMILKRKMPAILSSRFPLEVKEKYQIEITNRFATLENLNFDEDLNRAWENNKENIKTSAKENLVLHKLKRHKRWFDKECLGFLDQRKQAKMQ
jgi:hypothetical protein